MDAVLISTDSLKKRPTFIQANVEDSILRATIYRVQDVMISPILGRKLYERLCDAIKADSTGQPGGLNNNEKILINKYIVDLIMVGCEQRGVIHTTEQIRNKTTGENNDEAIKAIDRDRQKDLQAVFGWDFEHYRQLLICYLKENYRLYPEYYQPGEPGYCYCQDRPDNGLPFQKIHFL